MIEFDGYSKTFFMQKEYIVNELKSFLQDKNNWKQDEKFPFIFSNDKLEKFYVYNDYILYWEDIRCVEAVIKIQLPTNRSQIFKILGIK